MAYEAPATDREDSSLPVDVIRRLHGLLPSALGREDGSLMDYWLPTSTDRRLSRTSAEHAAVYDKVLDKWLEVTDPYMGLLYSVSADELDGVGRKQLRRRLKHELESVSEECLEARREVQYAIEAEQAQKTDREREEKAREKKSRQQRARDLMAMLDAGRDSARSVNSDGFNLLLAGANAALEAEAKRRSETASRLVDSRIA